MTDEELRSFIERASKQLAETPEMAVRNTQLRIVEPLLSLLGWDVRSTEVTAAWPTEYDEPFDYGLFVGDQPVIAVETFGTQTAVNPERLRGCLDRLERTGLDWGLVTNGRQFVFLARDEEAWARRSCGLDELTDHRAILYAYSSEYARQRLASRRKAADRLRDQRSALIEGITHSLKETAGAEFEGTFRSVATRAVDDAIAAVNRQRGSGSQGATPDGQQTRERPDRTDTSPDQPKSDTGTSNRDTPREGSTRSSESPTHSEEQTEAGPAPDDGGTTGTKPATNDGGARPAPDDGAPTGTESATDDRGGTAAESTSSTTGRANDQHEQSTPDTQSDTEYVVRFFEGSTTVGAVGNPTPAGAFVGVVSYLGEQRALTNRIETPWGLDESTALIARSPAHPDGTAMEQVREIGAYYLWTGGSTEVYREAIDELADVAGVRAMFQGDW